MASAIWTTAWSVYTYNQLLPLSQSEVVFSEDDINVMVDLNNRKDIVQPELRNVGKSPARNTRLSFYATFIDDPDSRILFLSNEGESAEVARWWREEEIVHDLQPGASTGFGQVSIEHIKLVIDKEGKIKETLDLAREKIQLVLIFQLKYEDGLTNAERENLFFFQYAVGSPDPIVSSLTNTDYNKIRPKLTKYFEEVNDNPYVLDFLKKNLPN